MPMQINDLPPSNITEPKGAAGVAVAPPPAKAQPVPKAQPPAAKPAEPKKDVAKAVETATAGTKTEVTDVKATGDTTAEGEPTFTLKINGKEVKATQSQIIAMAQRAVGAEAAMKQKAELEKLASNFLENFDNDTMGLLVQRHGKAKAKEIIVAMTKKLIAEEERDPRDVKIDELTAKNKEFESAQEAIKKQQEEQQRRANQQVLFKQMLIEIDKELNETHLPKDRLTFTRVLNYLAAGKRANGTSWTIKEAVKAVEVEDMGHASYYAKQYVEGKLPSEKFRAIFGEEAFKKLNKEQIETLKKADKIAKNDQPRGETPAAASPSPRRSLSKGRGSDGISEREYRRQFGSLGGI